MRASVKRAFEKNLWAVAIGVMLSLQGVAAPKNPHFYELVSGSYIADIPEGSIIQGSASHGGIQPDYIIDFEGSQFSELRGYLESLKSNSSLDLLRKIELIRREVDSILENKQYSDEENYRLAQSYKDENKDIPLGEYIRHRAGVCREHALILHKALSWAGIANHFVYASVERDMGSSDLIEDHAFNTVSIGGKEWVIDSYYKSFHGFLFADLQMGKIRPEKLPGIADFNSRRRILKINNYPLAWIPKPVGSSPICGKIF